MKIAIIGSGISGISVAKTFLDANYEIYLYEAANLSPKVSNKENLSFLPRTNVSPKYNDPLIKRGINKFKKSYRIKVKNFFLASPLISGGMSNFWGGGIEIPDNQYLKKNSYSKKILDEKKQLNSFLNLKENIFKYYKDFFKHNFHKKILKSKNGNIFFKKLGICASQDSKNLIFNSNEKVKSLKSNSLFNYIPNTFITNVKKHNSKYILIKSNKKKCNIKFDKVIISAGTIGSTLLTYNILNLNKDIKLYHTPAFKLIYFNPFLIFKKKIKKEYKHPLMQINYKLKNKVFKGSIMHAKNLDNSFFGVKKINFIFSWLKNFLYIGNFFLSSDYTDTYIKKVGKGFFIYSKLKIKLDNDLYSIKNNINDFLKRFFFFKIPFLNFTNFINGSDAHYTSTLYNLKINDKKVLKKNCEIERFENLHVLDGSVIADGLLYPTYFIMLNSIFISKQIIKNDKKNKNIH